MSKDQPIIHMCSSSYGRFVELDEHKRSLREIAQAAKRYLQSTQTTQGKRDTSPEAKALRAAITDALDTVEK